MQDTERVSSIFISLVYSPFHHLQPTDNDFNSRTFSDANSVLKKMNMDKISKTLPVIQAQFDALLDFGVESKDLNNGIIMYAFRLLCKDLFKMYAAYQELIINLLGRYFNLNHRRTREALDAYKGYLSRMDKVESFMHITDSIGLDKNEMPDFTKAPATLLAALERHYAQMDPKRRGAASVTPEAQETGEQQETSTDVPKDELAQAKVEEVVTGVSNVKVEDQVTVSESQLDLEKKSEEGPKQTQSKPSRPSPVSSSKREASPANKNSDPTPVKTEKKVPPERPSKPPSRPPPPSSSTPIKNQVTSPSRSPKAVGTTKPAKVASSVPHSSPTPPPPPPPPTNHHIRTSTPTAGSELPAPTQNSDSKSESVPEESAPPKADHEQSNGDVPEERNEGPPSDESHCRHESQHEEPVEEESNHVAGNHDVVEVQNDTNDGQAEEMPPPPPPLNNDEEEEDEGVVATE